MGGKHYFVSFIDDFSRRVWVYTMKYKIKYCYCLFVFPGVPPIHHTMIIIVVVVIIIAIGVTIIVIILPII